MSSCSSRSNSGPLMMMKSLKTRELWEMKGNLIYFINPVITTCVQSSATGVNESIFTLLQCKWKNSTLQITSIDQLIISRDCRVHDLHHHPLCVLTHQECKVVFFYVLYTVKNATKYVFVF